MKLSPRFTCRSFVALLLARLALMGQAKVSTSTAPPFPEGYIYDPAARYEPFDNLTEDLNQILLEPERAGVKRKKDDWQGRFCACVENGNIASWFQYASAMYIVDHCGPQDGIVLRTGHLQMRHIEILQAEMACDMLKLFTYCVSHNVPEAKPKWMSTCRRTHYTVEACDVECSAASPFSASAALMIAFLGAATFLFRA